MLRLRQTLYGCFLSGVGATIPGAVLALLAVLVLSAPRIQEGMAAVSPPFDLPLRVALLPVTRVLAAPEVPAGFWIKAEQQLVRRETHEEVTGPTWRETAAAWLGCDAERPRTPFGLLPGLLDPTDERRQRLCGELRHDERSGLARSWLVILLFSAGLGVAPRLEARLRPRDLAASRTARLDRLCAAGIVALVLAAIVLVHLLS